VCDNYRTKESFEDTKGVIRSHISKDIQWSKEKGQTMTYKTRHRQLSKLNKSNNTPVLSLLYERNYKSK
jgi:hypothetical protein